MGSQIVVYWEVRPVLQSNKVAKMRLNFALRGKCYSLFQNASCFVV